MKFTTSKEHRDFFQKNGWIEFEDLVLPDQLSLVNETIQEALRQRLHLSSVHSLQKASPEKLFAHGRDLWRDNSFLQKWISQTQFGEIAAELMMKKPLRLGYDQFLPQSQEKSLSPQKETLSPIYSTFLQKNLSLQEVSCLSEVACAVVVALNSSENLQKEANSNDAFPHKKGNIVFLQPSSSIDWSALPKYHEEQDLYMFVYTFSYSNYLLQPQDPHTHQLKRLGYIFNDKLSNKLHPIILR
jgi:hypothetical protein